MTDRGQGLPHLAHGRRVQRVLLGLDRPAAGRVHAIGPHALRHEASRPDRLPGGEQVVGPLGPQTVRPREIAIEVTQVKPANRGQLMDDHIRLRPSHGLRDLVGIKRIRHHRHSAQLVEHRLL